MGQNASKPPTSGAQGGHQHSHHHRGRSSAGGSSTSTPPVPITGPTRAPSSSRRDGGGSGSGAGTPSTTGSGHARVPSSRSAAVPPSETLVSATATPQRAAQRMSQAGSPAMLSENASPKPIAKSPLPEAIYSPQGQPKSSPMTAAMRGPDRERLPPPDERPSYGSVLPVFDYRAGGGADIYRPPRLPLPIEEEVHTPGSPILSPTEIKTAVPDGDVDDDDPESGMGMYNLDSGGNVTVPTLIEWKQPGEKVYVTGTFAGWSRKFRLNPDPARKSLSAVMHLPPGTHHLMFIVDNEAMTAEHLPVAVDFTNVLLNYIEVSADNAPPKKPAPSAAAGTSVPKQVTQLAANQQASAVPGQTPPQQLTAGQVPSQSSTPDPSSQQQPARPQPKLTPAGPPRPRRFDSTIPIYLRGLESSDNLSSSASTSYENLPDLSKDSPAPSLPIMLSKVILNSSTPVKDDSSVLNIPNHVVLNHLATSSIRFGCLASSGTTRYRRKYVTSIMYKPLREDPNASAASSPPPPIAAPVAGETAKASS